MADPALPIEPGYRDAIRLKGGRSMMAREKKIFAKRARTGKPWERGSLPPSRSADPIPKAVTL